MEDIKFSIKLTNLYIIYILSKWKYMGCGYFWGTVDSPCIPISFLQTHTKLLY